MLTVTPMIDIKQAVEKARVFAKDVLGENDLLLEEVSSDEDAFDITLSIPRRAGTPLLNIPSMRYADRREFKTFHVLKSDGTVTKMSIRELA
jgi:hypothetical protein